MCFLRKKGGDLRNYEHKIRFFCIESQELIFFLKRLTSGNQYFLALNAKWLYLFEPTITRKNATEVKFLKKMNIFLNFCVFSKYSNFGSFLIICIKFVLKHSWIICQYISKFPNLIEMLHLTSIHKVEKIDSQNISSVNSFWINL